MTEIIGGLWLSTTVLDASLVPFKEIVVNVLASLAIIKFNYALIMA